MSSSRRPDPLLEASVTVNCKPTPSISVASSMVSAALSLSVMVPTAVSVAVTKVLEELRLMPKVSLASRRESSRVATVNVFVSPAKAVQGGTTVSMTLSGDGECLRLAGRTRKHEVRHDVVEILRCDQWRPAAGGIDVTQCHTDGSTALHGFVQRDGKL